jgi:HK97 gp10 family phage protein
VTGIDLGGLDQVASLAVELSAAGPVVERRAHQVIVKGAADIETAGKVGCPVDTGNLRSSITQTVDDLAAEVGPEASYGGYVEIGTSRAAPQPFMGPAFDRVAPAVSAALADVAGQPLAGR